MVSVVIAALSGTASIGTAGLMDALNKADVAQALRTGGTAGRVLTGLDSGSVLCRDGVSQHPAVTAAEVTAPDLVVVPGLDDELAASFNENRRWVPWLRTWHGTSTSTSAVRSGLPNSRPCSA